jgi:hypothetical protein
METVMRTTHLLNNDGKVIGTIYIPKDYYGFVQFGTRAYEYREDHGGGYLSSMNYENGQPIYNVGSVVLNNNVILIP